MMHHDAATAEVLIFTTKEGVLSALAHDLKLKVTRFSLERASSPEGLRGEFDAHSVTVVSAMHQGAEVPSALSTAARAEIEQNIVTQVLAADRFKTVTFETTRVTDDEVEGRLMLHGVSKLVRGRRVDDAKHFIAEFRFDQRDFGIKPYSAMLGTLRIRPEVIVRVSIVKD